MSAREERGQPVRLPQPPIVAVRLRQRRLGGQANIHINSQVVCLRTISPFHLFRGLLALPTL